MTEWVVTVVGWRGQSRYSRSYYQSDTDDIIEATVAALNQSVLDADNIDTVVVMNANTLPGHVRPRG